MGHREEMGEKIVVEPGITHQGTEDLSSVCLEDVLGEGGDHRFVFKIRLRAGLPPGDMAELVVRQCSSDS